MKTTFISVDSLKNSLKKKPEKLDMFKRMDESFSKFKIERTGEYFYYSNYDNGIYDSNKNPITKVAEETDIWKQATNETRQLTKNNRPYWVRILFGQACNYSCEYCLQKDIGNPDERNKIETTDRFIEQLSKLDLSNLGKIDLWGGEPLLYWKSIMPIMEHFDREGLTWYMATNGTALQMKHVEFFSKLKGKVEIGISHDGPAHERLRGEEFLHKKVEVLKALQKLPNVDFSFNSVITNTNYDLFAINKFFYDYCTKNGLNINTIGLGWTIGRNHDYEDCGENSSNHVLRGESLEDFRNIIKRFMEACHEHFIMGQDQQLMNNALFTGGLGVLPYSRSLKEQVLPTVTTACGVDDSRVLSVDIAGNVRTCPHVDESFISGSLDDIAAVRLKNLDLNRYEKHCHKCPVYRLCKSNCPIEAPDEVFYQNCASEKVWWRAVQDASFKILFQSEVTLV